MGRFYAMDRDKRWERVKEGYDLIVNGTGKQATDMVQAMQESYDEGVTDEFIKPIHNASVKDGRLADVAPSILHIMGLEQPADMTGECLIQDNK